MDFSPKQLAKYLNTILKAQKKELASPKYSQLKIDWIRKTAIDILDLVKEKIKAFNTEYPNNVINNNDVVSTLQTALNVFLKSIGSTLKKE
jgi:hypothetical protein